MFGNTMRLVILFVLMAEIYSFKLIPRSLRCVSNDVAYTDFELCELIAANRGVPARASVTVRLLKIPVTNCLVHIELGSAKIKRAPLFINNTWDGCAFMRNRKRNLAISRLYDYIGSKTNLNHTCPYNHNIYVTNVTLAENPWVVPVPSGEYAGKLQFIVSGETKVTVTFTVELTQ